MFEPTQPGEVPGQAEAAPFNSPVFGPTRHASDTERAAICKAADETPVALFQELNRRLNERGFCLSIATLPERVQ